MVLVLNTSEVDGSVLSVVGGGSGGDDGRGSQNQCKAVKVELI